LDTHGTNVRKNPAHMRRGGIGPAKRQPV
jgi:hypothetical protein